MALKNWDAVYVSFNFPNTISVSCVNEKVTLELGISYPSLYFEKYKPDNLHVRSFWAIPIFSGNNKSQ